MSSLPEKTSMDLDRSADESVNGSVNESGDESVNQVEEDSNRNSSVSTPYDELHSSGSEVAQLPPKKIKKQVQTTLDSFTTKSGETKKSVSIKIKLTPKKLQSIQSSTKDQDSLSPSPSISISASKKRGRPKGNIAQNEPKLKLFNKRGRPKGSKVVQLVISEPSEPEDLPWVSDDDLSNEQPAMSDPDSIDCIPGIAFLVMFQARFYPVFKDIPQLGPQDFEIGLKEPQALSPNLEKFMCKLLTLLLNRKKPVEPGRYKGALEELHSQLPNLGLNPYWPTHIKLKAPDCVNELSWKDRLGFLQMLGLWTLTNSEAIRAIINTSGIDGRAKNSTDVANNDGEANSDGTPVASKVECLGSNIDNVRFWFIKGQEDTPFRIYKQSNPRLRYVSWEPVVGSSQELENFITNGELATDVSRQGSKLRDKLKKLLPELQESEERRLKNEKKEQKRQRQLQMIQMARKGEGEYVNRTRAKSKKVNYNLEDLSGVSYEEDEYYESSGGRSSRSARGARRSARIAAEDSTPVSYDDENDYEDRVNGVEQVDYDEDEIMDGEEEVVDFDEDEDFEEKAAKKEQDAVDYEPSEDEDEDEVDDNWRLRMDAQNELGALEGKPGGSATKGKPAGTPVGSTFVFPVVPPGFTGVPPGFTGFPPGYAGVPPGYAAAPPGYTGVPPGFAGYPPGFAGFPPGFTGFPPGFTGFPPGFSGVSPGNVPSFPPNAPVPYPIHFPMGVSVGPNGLPVNTPTPAVTNESYTGPFAPASSQPARSPIPPVNNQPVNSTSVPGKTHGSIPGSAATDAPTTTPSISVGDKIIPKSESPPSTKPSEINGAPTHLVT